MPESEHQMRDYHADERKELYSHFLVVIQDLIENQSKTEESVSDENPTLTALCDILETILSHGFIRASLISTSLS